MNKLVFPYNFHTHSVLCDGKDELEAMAAAAYDLGFKGLGFSGHLYVDGTSVSMSDESIKQYRETISGLKEAYEGRMSILCGAEADFFDNHDLSWCDYVIQSVHDFRFVIDGETFYVPTDLTAEILEDMVARYYGGDWYKVCEDFFEMEGKIAEKERVDIIGHFDYITKYNETHSYFDENDPRYVNSWMNALDRLVPLGKPFEINTAVFYRGMRKTPYLSPAILAEIKRRGGCITISGDVHDKTRLYQGFPEAIEFAHAAGFNSAVIMTEHGPEEIGI